MCHSFSTPFYPSATFYEAIGSTSLETHYLRQDEVGEMLPYLFYLNSFSHYGCHYRAIMGKCSCEILQKHYKTEFGSNGKAVKNVVM